MGRTEFLVKQRQEKWVTSQRGHGHEQQTDRCLHANSISETGTATGAPRAQLGTDAAARPAGEPEVTT